MPGKQVGVWLTKEAVRLALTGNAQGTGAEATLSTSVARGQHHASRYELVG